MVFSLLSYLGHGRGGRSGKAPPALQAAAGLPAEAGNHPASVKRRCLHCGKGVRVQGGRIGNQFRCPGCGTVQRIGRQ
jgi:hypothetical protein